MSRTTKLYATQLEDRTTPAKFTISVLSPLSGDVGETAATFSGSLTKTSAVTVTAADATAAVKAAFSGSIQATLGGTTLTHTFTSSAGTPGDPFRIDVDGEQVLISLEDQAGQPGCDWDYNDRVFALMVRQTGAATVLYSGTATWTGLGQTSLVTTTVTQDKVGYEGLYHWNYHVVNQTMTSGSAGLSYFFPGQMDEGGVGNISNTLGWNATFTEPVDGKRGIAWVDPGAYVAGPDLMPGQSGDFSFTTPPTGIDDAVGANVFGTDYDAEYAFGGGGQAKVPETVIRSVTLWGMPGSAPNPVGGVAGAPHAVILGNNPKEGGGKRIFPEKNKPGANSPVYDQVRVVVELSQPPTQNKTVNMYQFDVDDPSTDNFLTDPEFLAQDNKGTAIDQGATGVVGSFTLIVQAGKTTADVLRRVSPHAGDNYRFVGTIDTITLGTDVRIKERVELVPFPYSPIWPPFPASLLINADFYLDYRDGDRAGVYHNGGTGAAVADKDDKTVKSQLLTVWRRLHVERDIMGAPPSGEPFVPAPGFVRPGSGEEGNQEGDDDLAPDGPNGTVPKPGIALMQQNWRDAYIELVDDLEPYNTNVTHDFIHNVTGGIQGQNWTNIYAKQDIPQQGQGNAQIDPAFWSFMLLGAYEEETNADGDGAGDSYTMGLTHIRRTVCLVFTETIRDNWATFLSQFWAGKPNPLTQDELTQRIAFHESIHIFGFSHNLGHPFNAEGPLNANANTHGAPADNKLTPGQLGVIRSRTAPAVVPAGG